MKSDPIFSNLSPEILDLMEKEIQDLAKVKEELDTNWPWPLDAVQEWFEDLFNNIINLPHVVWDYIQEHLINPVVDWILSIGQYLYDIFKDAYEKALDEIENIPDPWKWLVLPFSLAKNFMIENIFKPTIDFIKGGLNSIVEGIRTALSPIIEPIQDFFGRVWDFFSKDVPQALWNTIKTGFEALGKGVTSFVSWLKEDVVPAIHGSLKWLWDSLINSIKGVYKWIINQATKVGERVKKGDIGAVLDLIGEYTAMTLPVQAMISVAGMKIMGSGLEVGELSRITKALFNPEVITGTLFGVIIGASVGTPLRYQFNRMFRPIIPDPGDIKTYYLRGLIDEARAKDLLAYHGLADEYIDMEIKSWTEIPSVTDLKTYYLRGYIDEETAKKFLRMRGYSEDYIKWEMDSWWVIPSISDLINFVVKEVISPKDFYEWAAKQGLSEYWAKNYWEAHWRLPSFENLREAYWRGIITREEFEKYIVWHDYKPEPRPGISKSDLDIIRELSYTLPGKIDARWMIRWGIIDRETHKQLLKMEGLHPDWIDKVAEAEYLNQLLDERNRVKSEAYTNYREGFITYKELKKALKDARFIDDEISYLLSAAQMARDREVKNMILRVYDDLLEKGYITKDVYVKELVNRGFDRKYVETRAETILLEYEKIKKKDLTKDERTALANLYVKMFKEGLIDEETLRKRLEEQELTPAEIEKRVERAKQEYASEILDLWIDYYKELFKKGLIDADTFESALIELGVREEKAKAMREYLETRYTEIESKDLTKDERNSLASTLLKLYRYGAISKDDLARRLVELGFSDDEVNLKLERADKEYENEIRELKLDILKEQMKQGLVDRSVFVNNCVELGYSADKCKALAELYWTKYIGVDYYVLTKDERSSLAYTYLKLYTRGLFTEAEIRQKLKELGYSDREIELKIERAKLEDAWEMIDDLIKFFDEQLRQGAMTEEQYVQQLVQLGIREDRARVRAKYVLRKIIAKELIAGA